MWEVLKREKQRKKIRLATGALFIALIAFVITAFDLGNKKDLHPTVSKQIEIRGIYGSPEPFWKKNLRLERIRRECHLYA